MRIQGVIQSTTWLFLNAALDLENQAIWAYGVAAGKLSDSKVGNVIKSLALRNQADHIKHRDIFIIHD